MRQLAALCGVFVMVALVLSACGRGSGNEEADVQNQVATGVAATQAARDATAEAEAAVAQAVDATVTALAAQTTADVGDESDGESDDDPGDDATEAAPDVEETPTPEPDVSTPTPSATVALPTATEQPTPTPIALVALPGGGGGGEEMEGDVFAVPGIFTIGDDPDTPIFSRFLSMQLLVRRPEKGPYDGAGISRVEIEVLNDDGQVVYTKTEENAGYCLFGGGLPECSVLRLEPGVAWPGTDRRIENRGYNVVFTVIPDQSHVDAGDWNQFFEVRIPGNDGGEAEGDQNEGELYAELAEVGRGGAGSTVSSNLVFQVVAVDSGKGNRDGDGINHVVLRIVGPDGNEVHSRQENNAAYCAFGGDAPCGAWDFAARSYRWPDGESIEAGRHRLQALVVADSGDSKVFEWQIEIRQGE